MTEREQPRDLDLPGRKATRRQHLVDAPLGSFNAGVHGTRPSLGPGWGIFRHAFGCPDLDRGAARAALDPAPASRNFGPLRHPCEPAMTMRGCLRGLELEPHA